MAWIAVGLKDDVPPGVVIPGRIENTELAIWCSVSGDYHAWSDRCPHRGMRLSHGFVRGETLACIYHGWQYDESGTCSYIPAHPALTPPATICVPSYHCKEAGGVIWTALGEDPASPPDLSGRLPVRSLPVNRSAQGVAAHFGAHSASVISVGGQHDVVLALQPGDGEQCVVHALAAPDHDRTAVSDWLERLRDTLEGTSS